MIRLVMWVILAAFFMAIALLVEKIAMAIDRKGRLVSRRAPQFTADSPAMANRRIHESYTEER